MVRKILAVFFAAVSIALCAIPAAADDTTSVETSTESEGISLTVRHFYSAFGSYDENDVTKQFDSIFISPDTQQLAPIFQTGGGANVPRFAYALVGTYSDFEDSKGLVRFIKNYTYHIKSVFRVKETATKGLNEYGGFALAIDDVFITPSISVSDKTNISTSDFLSILGKKNWVDGGATIDYNYDTEDETAFTRTYVTFTVDMYLRLNDEFEWSNYCGVVPLVRYLAASFDDTGNGTSNSSSLFEPMTVSCEAFFDPDGAIVDNQVSEIVGGQKDAVLFGQDRELSVTQNEANGRIDQGVSEANRVFDLKSYGNAFWTFTTAFGYTGTDFHFMFPDSGDVPFIGHLWDSQEIPLKEYIDKIPVVFLYILRFFAWLGLFLSFVHGVRTLIDDINGGEN